MLVTKTDMQQSSANQLLPTNMHVQEHRHTHTHMLACTPAWLPPVPYSALLAHWPTYGWMEVALGLPWSVECMCTVCVQHRVMYPHVTSMNADKLTGFVCEPVAKLCCLLPFCSLTVRPGLLLYSRYPIQILRLFSPYVNCSFYHYPKIVTIYINVIM